MNELSFLSGFDFFDHDEKRYDPSLIIRIEIQEKRVFYEFNRTIEKIESRFFERDHSDHRKQLCRLKLQIRCRFCNR
jgi:hypothetical protein